jgi:hypothetical protein
MALAMFTEIQKDHILDVKQQIQQHVWKMQETPWADNYVIPWNHIFLSGGAIASLIQGETPKDWDYYFYDTVSMEHLSEHLQEEQHLDHVADVDPKYAQIIVNSGRPQGKMVTLNAITLKSTDSFITMLTGTPMEVTKTFDYVHCTPFYSIGTDELYISPLQYKACRLRLLIVNNEANVKETREQKFKARGYR